MSAIGDMQDDAERDLKADNAGLRRKLAEQQARFARINGATPAYAEICGEEELTSQLSAAKQEARRALMNELSNPTDAMYEAGMSHLAGKGTAWCINDLFKAMLTGAK